MNSDELLTALESNLNKYDRIILIINDSIGENNLFSEFINSEAIKKSTKKIMIMSSEDGKESENYAYYRLSEVEEEQLVKLYLMYEFSDRFQILSYDSNFGNIFNYVKTGIMTAEEAFEAILY